MSNLYPQRCLNRQSIYSSSQSDINFISSLKLSEIFSILQKNLPICSQCKLRQKNHYCMEMDCRRKGLLCINCDIKSIEGKHYLHDFTFLVPLFSQNVFENFYQLKDSFQSFQDQVSSEINKIYQYLQNLYKIQDISSRQLQKLQKHQKEGKYRQFSQKLKDLVGSVRSKTELSQQKEDQMKEKLQDIFCNVNFISHEECLLKQHQMRKQLMVQIQKLNWLQNPQQILSQLLKQNHINMNSSTMYDQQSDIYISSRKTISITQIDSFFRNYNELFTQNLQHHKVQVKIESQLLQKPRFYQAFIYHFKECQKLSIDNANMSYLKTPLSFRKLKELQFNCNVETDTICNSKIQNQNQELESFTIRKFREEDIKLLKFITAPCKKLKHLHLEFANKSDLSHSRDLVEYLGQEMEKDLRQFVLKIRIQSEVKRLYGYLSKFNRETPDFSINLSNAILQLLKSNPNLTKVIIDGVKGLDTIQVLNTLFDMEFLLQYEITYENVNLMSELHNETSRVLAVKVEKRRRMLASLAKMTKDKYYTRQILHTIGEEFLG